MTDYYVIQKIANKAYLFEVVERRMGELSTEIADRCREIISQARIFHRGEFFFMDRTSLLASNISYLLEEV
tara:strand:+ start:2481 stop:2693 length:213 start_codon:yes stop_codon:yes gene_type:complete